LRDRWAPAVALPTRAGAARDELSRVATERETAVSSDEETAAVFARRLNPARPVFQ